MAPCDGRGPSSTPHERQEPKLERLEPSEERLAQGGERLTQDGERLEGERLEGRGERLGPLTKLRMGALGQATDLYLPMLHEGPLRVA